MHQWRWSRYHNDYVHPRNPWSFPIEELTSRDTTKIWEETTPWVEDFSHHVTSVTAFVWSHSCCPLPARWLGRSSESRESTEILWEFRGKSRKNVTFDFFSPAQACRLFPIFFNVVGLRTPDIIRPMKHVNSLTSCFALASTLLPSAPLSPTFLTTLGRALVSLFL